MHSIPWQVDVLFWILLIGLAAGVGAVVLWWRRR